MLSRQLGHLMNLDFKPNKLGKLLWPTETISISIQTLMVTIQTRQGSLPQKVYIALSE